MGTVQIEIKDGIGAIRLSGPRGNALSAEMVGDLSSALRTVGGEAQVKAVLLASTHPRLFCPGLDLVSLSQIGRTEMGAFMLTFASLLTDLFALKKPLVAAVNGPAVAGGCLLALAADWRVLKRGAPMGLHEVKLGVPLPWSAVMLLKSAVPASALASVALLGRNFEGEAAQGAGFANEVAEEENFGATVHARLAEFAEKDAFAFGVTKGYLRRAAVASMRERETALLDEFLDGWFGEATQARIAETVSALQKKD